MKRLWIIPWLLLYFLIISGVRFSACHSCCGGAIARAGMRKGPCGDPAKKGCCTDFCRLLAVRDTRQQSVSESLRLPVSHSGAVSLPPGIFSLPAPGAPTPPVPPPPLDAGDPLYVCYGSLVI